MTDEQIIQNAIKAATEFKDWYHPQMSFYDGYIAGAHSRDEEISRIQESLDECRRTLFQLCNPWRNAKTDLPKDMKPVVGYDDGRIDIYEYSPEENIWSIGMLISDAPEYWMPIPELSKEGQR